ncbi:ACT domain-containing protein [Alteromonas marina]|uniref:ACT domain-containing protein n=1 Tax=unclassified Alteromonas TaxID=2614992 RepID=UPI0012E5374F|nr:ACT domain-containing protein [Alteromonas sp. KUL150]GFD76890.1 transporter [Tenacibaculum sp. KUL113]GFD87634.1 transporter [Alteromonas sp. KUL150]
MIAETDLSVLLKNLNPVASSENYVFTTLPADKLSSTLVSVAKGMFQECEGTTLILPVAAAKQANLQFEGYYRCITCEVHSSLEAVGMTAAMSTALGNAGISANVVAAYYHDHIFVPVEKVDVALDVLTSLSN